MCAILAHREPGRIASPIASCACSAFGAAIGPGSGARAAPIRSRYEITRSRLDPQLLPISRSRLFTAIWI